MEERIQPLFSSLLNETIWALVTGLCGKILLTGGALFTGGRGGSESLGVPLDCKDRKNSLQCTVLPAKSDSDVMFCLQSYQGLYFTIDHLCINPIHRIGLIHK